MKIVRDSVKIVCDVKGCNNLAEYKLILDVGGYDMLRLCSNCLKSFYREAEKNIGKEAKIATRKAKKRG